jgi:hypothetical protein
MLPAANPSFSALWRLGRDGLRERQPLAMRATAFRFMCKSQIYDESADSQAVPPVTRQTRVNQLRNIALGRLGQHSNLPTNQSVPLNS